MKNLCIYHKSCADGFGAALVVKDYFGKKAESCEFLPAHYGDEAPNVTETNVVIVDFSYPKEVLLRMEEQAASIVVLDHHRTAEADLKGLDFCEFDMTRSGAMMAWDHFNPTSEAPKLIQYIQDRDLWQWKLENSREISCGLQLLPFEFKNWWYYLYTDKLDGLATKGKAILEYQEQQVLRALYPTNIRMVTILGHNVPILNSTTLISEICGRLAEGNPFAVTYFDTPTDRIYSLRSREGGEDVSIVAKVFGGGGHCQAAGFSIPLSEKQL